MFIAKCRCVLIFKKQEAQYWVYFKSTEITPRLRFICTYCSEKHGLYNPSRGDNRLQNAQVNKQSKKGLGMQVLGMQIISAFGMTLITMLGT